MLAALFVTLLVVVETHGGRPFAVDRALHDAALRHRSAGATRAWSYVSGIGTGPVAYALAALGGACGRRRAGRVALGALSSLALLVLGQLVRSGIMTAVARPRPPVADWAVATSGWAFPSGHTTTSALAAALLCAGLLRTGLPRRWAAGLCALAVLWALAVGVSRVLLGVHWPSDVLGGELLAGALVCVVAALRPAPASGPRGSGRAARRSAAPGRAATGPAARP